MKKLLVIAAVVAMFGLASCNKAETVEETTSTGTAVEATSTGEVVEATDVEAAQ